MRWQSGSQAPRAYEIQFVGQPDKIDVSGSDNDAFSERARVAEPKGWLCWDRSAHHRPGTSRTARNR